MFSYIKQNYSNFTFSLDHSPPSNLTSLSTSANLINDKFFFKSRNTYRWDPFLKNNTIFFLC